MHICPKLLAEAAGKNIDITTTVKLLECARKFKLKKFGLNTYNDPDLIKIFKGFPFEAAYSIFSINQETQRDGFKDPTVSKVIDKFKNTAEHNHKYRGGNCGNGFQFALPYMYDFTTLHYITGIYTLNEDKQTYDFKSISKENAEVKN